MSHWADIWTFDRKKHHVEFKFPFIKMLWHSDEYTNNELIIFYYSKISRNQ